MEYSLRRTDLFPTPIWTTDLPQFGPRIHNMIAVAEQVLLESPAPPDDPLQQSRAILQDHPDPDWVEFYRVLAEIMEGILGRELPPRYGFARAFLRSWVLKADDLEEWRSTASTLKALHSHLPSVLSSVFYLQMPDSFVNAPSGGTTLKDPGSAYTSPYRPPEFHVSPAPLRLVIFPGWVEHMPEPPAPGLELDKPRIIVSTDLQVDLS